MKKQIIDFFENLKRKIVQKRIKKVLLKKYTHDYEVELVLEQWIIKRILDGQTARRKELAEKQARIKEMEMFINYLQEK